jgi:hypothetical protein
MPGRDFFKPRVRRVLCNARPWPSSPTGGVAGDSRELIAKLAARHRLPAIYPFRYFAVAGGLMSYGPDVVDLFRRAAAYVDRILRGAKPADLPVQQPTKYDGSPSRSSRRKA